VAKFESRVALQRYLLPENHRPPLKRCLVCGVTMLAGKSDEKLPRFDTFTCLKCGSVTTYAPRQIEPKQDK